MLQELRIQNLVLIESATVHFGCGLNALTGETGSGKSAIMAALGLIAGERADLSMIRHGSDKGSVEAVFAVDSAPELKHLLEEAGIDAPLDEPLIIRREIATGGKGRSLLNHQPVHASLLRTLAPFLFELVGQHANHLLFAAESHRKTVDFYGDLTPKVREFAASWHEEALWRKELEELVSEEAQRLRNIDRFRAEIEEIAEADIKEGEDDELFAEYTRLINAEELAAKAGALIDDLSGEHKAIIPTLRQGVKLLEELSRLDTAFAETTKSYMNALVELDEAGYMLQKYHSGIEYNPQRALELNERLALIAKLKRKYGPSIAEMKGYELDLKRHLTALENASTRIDELKQQIAERSRLNDAGAKELTRSRTEAGAQLSEALTRQLRSLNMPHVELTVAIEKQKRSQHGDDKVEFHMKPNKGERSIPVRECASGGELSRLLLSIRTLLAGKQAIPCLIFDEVDANIGGETATIVGEKLREIAKQHQVLCITHFPQVAMQSDHHVQISKEEKEGRTITVIRSVSGALRERELQRMRG